MYVLSWEADVVNENKPKGYLRNIKTESWDILSLVLKSQ
jgi:hypothetical protein